MAERKFYDSTVTLSNTGNLLSTVGYMFVLTDMAQGSGTQNRIGDKCTGSSLEIRYQLFSPGLVTTNPYITFRLILFVWKDDTTPTTADLLDAIGLTPPLSPYNHDLRIKRKVLYDGVHTQYLEPVSKNCSIPNKFKKIILPLNKLRRGLNIVNFQSGTTIAVNHIYAYMVSDTANTANLTWTLEFTGRYNFIDM